MTYRVYLTIEMPDEYGTKEAATAAAIEALRDAVASPLQNHSVAARASLNLMRGSAVQARVFAADTITSGAQHAFLVDIHDGCI